MRVGRAAVSTLLLAVSAWMPGCAYEMAPASRGLAESAAVDAARSAAATTSAELPRTTAVGGGAVASADPTAEAAGALPSAADRKLVRDASLVIGVVDRDAAVSRAGRLATESGGYVQTAESDVLTLRVPGDQFDAVLDELARIGLVKERKIQVRDVTEEYVDLELRLKSKRTMLERLEALAARAEKMEDLLRVEQEIARLIQEAEQLEGKLRLLSSRVTMGCIAIRFTETAVVAEHAPMPRLPFWWLHTLGLSALTN